MEGGLVCNFLTLLWFSVLSAFDDGIPEPTTKPLILEVQCTCLIIKLVKNFDFGSSCHVGTPLRWKVLLYSLIHWYFSCRNCLSSYLSFQITANLLFSSVHPHAVSFSPVCYLLLPIFLLLLLSSPLIRLSTFLTLDLVDNLLPVVEAPEQWILTCLSIHLCI